MTTPEGPANGNPGERPAWGQPPAGGWGEKPADAAAETRSWSEDGAPVDPPRQQPGGEATRLEQPGAWAGPPNPGQQNQGQQNQGPGGWGPPQGGQPWGGQPPAQNTQAPAWAQQPPPGGGWGPPQQQYPGGPYPGGPQHPAGQPQWGPPGYPSLPGPPSGPRRSRVPFVVAGVLVLLLGTGALLAFVTPGFLNTTVFDRAALQSGVQRILTADYQYTGVGEVVCGDPAGSPITVRAGDTFTCTTTIDGAPATVPVRITSADGGYEVSRPA